MLIGCLLESTRWNLRNTNCKQVVLGISHDAGYAPFLDEILQDEGTRRLVTILEGCPTVREIKATNVHIMGQIDTLFRAEKLVDRTPRHPSPVGTKAAPVTSATAASAAGGGSYARIIPGAGLPRQMTFPIPLQPKPNGASRGTPKPAPWSPGPRGCDPAPNYSPQAMESIKKRKEGHKLCNNHYLRGPCSKGDACCFVHDYKPTQDERNAIAFLARLNPCGMGQECEAEDCIYGHNVSHTLFPFWSLHHVRDQSWTFKCPRLSVPAAKSDCSPSG